MLSGVWTVCFRIDASHIQQFDWPLLPIIITTDWLQKLQLSRCPVNGVEVLSVCVDCSDGCSEQVSQLRCLGQLKLLDLSHTLLTDTGMSRIAVKVRTYQPPQSRQRHWRLRRVLQAASLEDLHIDGCSAMSGAGFESVCQITTLSTLSGAGCGWLTDALVDQVLPQLPYLSSLDLSKCSQLTPDCMSTISSLASLNHLSMCGQRQWKCSLVEVRYA